MKVLNAWTIYVIIVFLMALVVFITYQMKEAKIQSPLPKDYTRPDTLNEGLPIPRSVLDTWPHWKKFFEDIEKIAVYYKEDKVIFNYINDDNGISITDSVTGGPDITVEHNKENHDFDVTVSSLNNSEVRGLIESFYNNFF